MPLLPTAPPDYLEIIEDARIIAENLLNMYRRSIEFKYLLDEWYIFEERTSTIDLFFEFGFEDDEIQETSLCIFMEENGAELSAIRDMIEDEEDNKTIVFDHCEIIHG